MAKALPYQSIWSRKDWLDHIAWWALKLHLAKNYDYFLNEINNGYKKKVKWDWDKDTQKWISLLLTEDLLNKALMLTVIREL